ncbi:MAG TPA: hypothetical protein VFQ61_22255 [Polyangiaceae bacterium]|nr:hypothetical protein [Polyangiaceae bacterium]
MQLRPASSEPARFEVLDALGGWFRLEAGEATLAGSIPLRAARACSPFLEGNAIGYRLVTDAVFRVQRRLGLWRVEVSVPEAVRRAQRANLPQIAVTMANGGATSGADAARRGLMTRLERELVWIDGVTSSIPKLILFTGLFVRALPDCELLLSSAGNRRSVTYGVEPGWVRATELVPLLIELTYRGLGDMTWEITGEVASLLPLLRPMSLETRSLSARSNLGEAHARFFDTNYFAQKKRGPTRKYKSMITESGSARAEQAPSTIGEWVEIVSRPQTANVRAETIPESDCGAAHLVRNAVSFDARFDGQHVVVTCDPVEMREHANRIEAEWRALYGELGDARGALLYFTKYATLHQAGEPFFFVKPPALVSTPPGTACLVEGLCGPEYDVLRGVIRTDVFHAVPTVIRLNWPGKKIRVPKGMPLAWVVPFERSSPHPSYRRREL